MIPTKKKVIGIIMTYNCEKYLAEVFSRIPRYLLDDLICVDDASSDGTVALAQSLGLKTFTHPHAGYGGNLLFGLRKSVEMGGTHMIEIHGDGQYNIEEGIPLAIKKMDEGVDFVLGNRFFSAMQPFRDGMSPVQYGGNRLLSAIGLLGTWIPLTDFFPGFRAYSRRFVETLDFSVLSQDYFFSFQIILLSRYAGLTIGDVPIRCDYKREHTSISLAKGVWAIFQTMHAISVYWLALLGWKRGIFRHQKRFAK